MLDCMTNKSQQVSTSRLATGKSCVIAFVSVRWTKRCGPSRTGTSWPASCSCHTPKFNSLHLMSAEVNQPDWSGVFGMKRNKSMLHSAVLLVCAGLCAGGMGGTAAAQQAGTSPKIKKNVKLTSRSLYSAEELRRIVDQTVAEEAARYRIDPLLIYAMIEQESGFKPHALSPKGALGLMQLMPGTAARFGVRDRRDPRESIRAGVKYLVWLLDRFDGNVRLGLAGYNAGEGAVDKYGRRIPPYDETREYVRRIEANYLRMARIRSNGGEVPGSTRVATSQPSNEAGGAPEAPSYSYRFRLRKADSTTTSAMVQPTVTAGTTSKQ